jgi:thiol-disulfide isomerase/thioredoxin
MLMTHSIAATLLSMSVLAADASKPVERLNFNLKDLDGKAITAEQYRGQFALVNFWATWCGPCIKEMPVLSDFDAKHADVQVIGFAYDETEASEIQAFLKKRPVVYRNVQIDVFNPPDTLPTPRGLPLTHLYGPDGALLEKFIGEISAQDLEKALAKHRSATQAASP